jgi:hypothetical protein
MTITEAAGRLRKDDIRGSQNFVSEMATADRGERAFSPTSSPVLTSKLSPGRKAQTIDAGFSARQPIASRVPAAVDQGV